MTIKETRAATGMTQRSFAEKYRIPLQTLKQWESGGASSSHRVPPAYVEHMLARLVDLDFGTPPHQRKSAAEHLIDAAKDSRHDGSHWMRYLRKEMDGGVFLLSEEDLGQALASDGLTMFQKVSLKRAAVQGSATQRHLASLNARAATPMIDEVRGRNAHVAK